MNRSDQSEYACHLHNGRVVGSSRFVYSSSEGPFLYKKETLPYVVLGSEGPIRVLAFMLGFVSKLDPQNQPEKHTHENKLLPLAVAHAWTIGCHELMKLVRQIFIDIVTAKSAYGYTKLCFDFIIKRL